MAGAIGNRHTLQPHEWHAILAGEQGPWCRCARDQAQMHPSGGPLEVRVVYPGGATADVTHAVLDLARENHGAGGAEPRLTFAFRSAYQGVVHYTVEGDGEGYRIVVDNGGAPYRHNGGTIPARVLAAFLAWRTAQDDLGAQRA